MNVTRDPSRPERWRSPPAPVNHADGFALAALQEGFAASVVMQRDAPLAKPRAARRKSELGADPRWRCWRPGRRRSKAMPRTAAGPARAYDCRDQTGRARNAKRRVVHR